MGDGYDAVVGISGIVEKDRFTDDRPVSWYKDFQGGRSWVTLAGHNIDAFQNSDYLQHIYGGVLYAAGVVYGCTDSTYDEFDSLATHDDGTCEILALEPGQDRIHSVYLDQEGDGVLSVFRPEKGPYVIEIFNMLGVPILKRGALGGRTYMFEGFENEGIVFVKITAGKDFHVEKVVVARQY